MTTGGPLLHAPLGRGEADAGAGRRRDHHHLAGQQPVAGGRHRGGGRPGGVGVGVGHRGPLGLGRQAEDPLADDVLLDLVGAAVDGLGPAEQEGALELVELVGEPLGHQAGRPPDVHGQLAQLPVPAGPVQLDDRGLGRGHRAVDARQAAQRVEAQDLELGVGAGQRWRMTGSRCAPLARATATRWSSSRRKESWWPSRATPRSKARVARATRQPSPTSPTTLSAGGPGPSKNTSLNSEVRVSWVMGRTSTPGWSMGTRR
jgi:hypothetical protein